ncbi:hypothetical protein [Halobaculum sp. D14]|uniref:hypothetical protein n=1 Tax=Halobaculum sp. D14 TaxID=3421642 RepID=UPI003EB9C882
MVRDLNEQLGMTPQGTRKRLESLVDKGYLTSRKVGGSAKVYWLTDEGKELASTAASGDYSAQ